MAFTGYTIVEPARFLQTLEEVRERGWATSREEAHLGSSSVAAPILLPPDGRAVAALSVVGPTERLDGHEERIANLLTRAAADISRRLERALGLTSEQREQPALRVGLVAGHRASEGSAALEQLGLRRNDLETGVDQFGIETGRLFGRRRDVPPVDEDVDEPVTAVDLAGHRSVRHRARRRHGTGRPNAAAAAADDAS